MSTKGLLVMLFCIASTCKQTGYAQSKFRFDVGLNYNNTTNLHPQEWGGGIFFATKYVLTDNFKVGLKLDGDFLWDRSITNSSAEYTMDVVSKFQATADYSFGNGKIRPYVGLGAGFYELHILNSVGVDQTIYVTDKGQSLGVSPTIGLQGKHWLLQAIYNISAKQNNPKYISIGVGYSFGGGK